jgi:hypothetical protein
MVHSARERPNAREGREHRRRRGRLWQGYTDYAGGLGDGVGGPPQPFDGFPTYPQHGDARCSAPWAGAGQAAQDRVG